LKDKIKIKGKLPVIKFFSSHESGEIPKYQHIIGTLDYTICGYATHEYEIKSKIGRLTCPTCISELNNFKEFYEVKRA